ncbi:CPBP family intramembrane glutamic endopeptidase [Chryseobacterium gwangjuense]|uniref:CPBP family intramembrane glutamic endopeptidase n=1 Tax=Chryseobacterium gwangjuense TaxID=1069980 RepID=UPI001E58C805|nr:CPBP family intramembrane glutamic endopeptidase [Chryseobacterium gwangjuense]MCE3076636.1 CPBP family intramembrane metalloprotease [Chryseobacterium gwangjuense]
MTYFLTLKNDFLDLISFIKKPNDIQIKITPRQKLLLIFNLLIIEIIFSLLFVFPANYIAEKFINVKETETLKNLTLFGALFLVVFLAPLLEEWIFRYSLRYHKLFSSFINREKWDKIFPFLVYAFSIVFGFVHLDNYVNDSSLFYALSPLIIISQLSGGLMLSYIRIRLNIAYSFLYHAIWNGLFAIVVPSIFLLFTPPFVDQTTSYDLKMEQKVFVSTREPIFLTVSISKNKIYSLKGNQYQFQRLLDYIYGKEKFYVDEGLINIQFTSKKGISKEDFLKILQKEYDIR